MKAQMANLRMFFRVLSCTMNKCLAVLCLFGEGAQESTSTQSTNAKHSSSGLASGSTRGEWIEVARK